MEKVGGGGGDGDRFLEIVAFFFPLGCGTISGRSSGLPDLLCGHTCSWPSWACCRAKCFAGDVGSIGIAFIILFALGRRCEMGKSEHEALNNVEGHFHLMPYDFCCQETMIVEGTK